MTPPGIRSAGAAAVSAILLPPTYMYVYIQTYKSNIYIYIHIYTYTRVYICVYTYIYRFPPTALISWRHPASGQHVPQLYHRYMCVYGCMCVCICVRIYVYVHSLPQHLLDNATRHRIGMCRSCIIVICVYMYVYVCVYICVYICICAFPPTAFTR